MCCRYDKYETDAEGVSSGVFVCVFTPPSFLKSSSCEGDYGDEGENRIASSPLYNRIHCIHLYIYVYNIIYIIMLHNYVITCAGTFSSLDTSSKYETSTADIQHCMIFYFIFFFVLLRYLKNHCLFFASFFSIII